MADNEVNYRLTGSASSELKSTIAEIEAALDRLQAKSNLTIRGGAAGGFAGTSGGGRGGGGAAQQIAQSVSPSGGAASVSQPAYAEAVSSSGNGKAPKTRASSSQAQSAASVDAIPDYSSLDRTMVYRRAATGQEQDAYAAYARLARKQGYEPDLDVYATTEKYEKTLNQMPASMVYSPADYPGNVRTQKMSKAALRAAGVYDEYLDVPDPNARSSRGSILRMIGLSMGAHAFAQGGSAYLQGQTQRILTGRVDELGDTGSIWDLAGSVAGAGAGVGANLFGYQYEGAIGTDTSAKATFLNPFFAAGLGANTLGPLAGALGRRLAAPEAARAAMIQVGNPTFAMQAGILGVGSSFGTLSGASPPVFSSMGPVGSILRGIWGNYSSAQELFAPSRMTGIDPNHALLPGWITESQRMIKYFGDPSDTRRMTGLTGYITRNFAGGVLKYGPSTQDAMEVYGGWFGSLMAGGINPLSPAGTTSPVVTSRAAEVASPGTPGHWDGGTPGTPGKWVPGTPATRGYWEYYQPESPAAPSAASGTSLASASVVAPGLAGSEPTSTKKKPSLLDIIGKDLRRFVSDWSEDSWPERISNLTGALPALPLAVAGAQKELGGPATGMLQSARRASQVPPMTPRLTTTASAAVTGMRARWVPGDPGTPGHFEPGTPGSRGTWVPGLQGTPGVTEETVQIQETIVDRLARRTMEEWPAASKEMQKRLGPVVSTLLETGGNWADILMQYGPQTASEFSKVIVEHNETPELDPVLAMGVSSAYRGAARDSRLASYRARGGPREMAVQAWNQMTALGRLPGGRYSAAYAEAGVSARDAMMAGFAEDNAINYGIPLARLSGVEQRMDIMPFAPGNRMAVGLAKAGVEDRMVRKLFQQMGMLRSTGQLTAEAELSMTSQIESLRTDIAQSIASVADGVENRLPAMQAGMPAGFSRYNTMTLAAANMGRVGFPARSFGAANAAQANALDRLYNGLGMPSGFPTGRTEALSTSLLIGNNKLLERIASAVERLAGQSLDPKASGPLRSTAGLLSGGPGSQLNATGVN